MKSDTIFALGTLLLGVAEAATCDLTNNFAEPVLANGWEHRLIAKGLTKPRSILFDSEGNLLVIQQGAGLIHLAFDDGGSTCLDVAKKTFLINSTEVSKLPLFVYDAPVGMAEADSYVVEPWPRAFERWQNPLCLLL